MKWILIAGLALSLAGCASLGGWVEGRDMRAEYRGRLYAAAHCAGCHAIAGRADSPNTLATPFPNLKFLYSERGLLREFEVIGEVGHYDMAATAIPLQDRHDLLKYIGNLKGGAAP